MRNNRIMRFLWLGLLLLSTAVAAGPKIEHWRTESGARVYFVQAEGLPLLDLRVLFQAGSARDGDHPGLAALTSLLLDKGAGSWSADAIAQRLEGIGAELDTGAKKDSAWISLRALTEPKILTQALETAATVLAQPRFDEADVEREKKRVLVALRQREESPSALAEMAYMKALYGDHPYAHPADGYPETVAELDRDNLLAFYRQYYVAANAVVVLVGDVSRERAEAVVERLLQGVAPGAPAAALAEVPEPANASSEYKPFPSTQTHVYSGMPVLRFQDPDYFPLYVGNHILGGSGLTSRISQEVREKRGLSYSAYSYFSPMAQAGPFTMGLQTRSDQTEQALLVLRQTLGEFIVKGPTEEELVAAKKNITGGFVLRYDSNAKLAEYVSMIGFYNLPLDYLETFSEKVNAVSREDIAKAFTARVHPERFQTVLVGAETGAAGGQ